jgi:pyridoxal phosphate enzyme (YggS family)
MNTIAHNLQSVHSQIQAACAASGRHSTSVRLLAVSKTCAADRVRAAFSAGQTAFGENYIQEAVDKMVLLADLPIEWHCIGPVQSNKTRLVAQHFDWVHSVDRLKIAQRLDAHRPQEKGPLNVCIQVNLDASPSKAGVSPVDALALALEVAQLPHLRLRGLMTLPEPAPSYEAARAAHDQAKRLWDALNREGLALDTLSMGMSADLDAAIHAGSTMVRVGTALFGARTPSTRAP